MEVCVRTGQRPRWLENGDRRPPDVPQTETRATIGTLASSPIATCCVLRETYSARCEGACGCGCAFGCACADECVPLELWYMAKRDWRGAGAARTAASIAGERGLTRIFLCAARIVPAKGVTATDFIKRGNAAARNAKSGARMLDPVKKLSSFKELNYRFKPFQLDRPARRRARVAPRSRRLAQSFSCQLVPSGSSSPCP